MLRMKSVAEAERFRVGNLEWGLPELCAQLALGSPDASSAAPAMQGERDVNADIRDAVLMSRHCDQVILEAAFSISVWLDDGVCGKMCHAARDVFGAVLDVD